MSDTAPRIELWEDLEGAALKRQICFALDDIDRRVAGHEAADKAAFDEVRNQNRWILTAVFAAVLELTTALVLYIALR